MQPTQIIYSCLAGGALVCGGAAAVHSLTSASGSTRAPGAVAEPDALVQLRVEDAEESQTRIAFNTGQSIGEKISTQPGVSERLQLARQEGSTTGSAIVAQQATAGPTTPIINFDSDTGPVSPGSGSSSPLPAQAPSLGAKQQAQPGGVAILGGGSSGGGSGGSGLSTGSSGGGGASGGGGGAGAGSAGADSADQGVDATAQVDPADDSEIIEVPAAEDVASTEQNETDSADEPSTDLSAATPSADEPEKIETPAVEQPAQDNPTDQADDPAPVPTVPKFRGGVGSNNRVLAFPGAKGYGAYTSGGRGGDTYIVSTLSDSGAGSLRYGIQGAKGPRTIVFQTGGTIYLSSPLTIDKDNLTIAGQTAPGDGITIAGQPVVLSSKNVILRHLRIRVGDINAMDRPAGQNHKPIAYKAGKGLKNLLGDAADALSIVNASDVVIDHVSTSWSIDECLSVTRSSNVTVQNCIIAESLYDSYHTSGPHSYGSLIVGASGIDSGVTFTQNLFMHNYARSPGVSIYFPEVETTGRLRMDFANNLVYNWGALAFHVLKREDGQGLLEMSFSGNLYIPGGDTQTLDDRTFRNITDRTLYARKNAYSDEADQYSDLFSLPSLAKLSIETGNPSFPFVSNYPPALLEQWVSDYAGAYLNRDAVDTRLLSDFEDREGRIINSQDEVGGFPTLAEGTAPADTDRDGMPDAWENDKGLNPADPNDANHLTTPGWTNLETYLNSLIVYEDNSDIDTLLMMQD